MIACIFIWQANLFIASLLLRSVHLFVSKFNLSFAPGNFILRPKICFQTTLQIIHTRISAALKRLNSVYPAIAKRKSLDECVALRIINNLVSRALMYKINNDLPEDTKAAIRETLLDQARKLRMEVITIN